MKANVYNESREVGNDSWLSWSLLFTSRNYLTPFFSGKLKLRLLISDRKHCLLCKIMKNSINEREKSSKESWKSLEES